MRRLVLILLALALTVAPVFGDELPDRNDVGESKSTKEIYEQLIIDIYLLGELRKNLDDHEKMRAIVRAAENENKGEPREGDGYQEGLVAFKRKEYQKAAEQGHALAQYNLAFRYGLGKGVPRDFVLAHMWLSLAKAQGDEKAGGKMRAIIYNSMKWTVEKLMTPAQLAEAQRLAREWKPKGK